MDKPLPCRELRVVSEDPEKLIKVIWILVTRSPPIVLWETVVRFAPDFILETGLAPVIGLTPLVPSAITIFMTQRKLRRLQQAERRFCLRIQNRGVFIREIIVPRQSRASFFFGSRYPESTGTTSSVGTIERFVPWSAFRGFVQGWGGCTLVGANSQAGDISGVGAADWKRDFSPRSEGSYPISFHGLTGGTGVELISLLRRAGVSKMTGEQRPRVFLAPIHIVVGGIGLSIVAQGIIYFIV